MSDDQAPPEPARTRIPRERLDLAEAMWVAGTTAREIQTKLAIKYGVTRRQTRTYIRLARERIAKNDKDDAHTAAVSGKARAEEMLLEVWALAKNATFKGVASPDTKTMERVATRLAELNGAMAPKKLELDASGLAEFIGLAFGEEPGASREGPRPPPPLEG